MSVLDNITGTEFTLTIIVIGTIVGLMLLKVIFKGMPLENSHASRRQKS